MALRMAGRNHPLLLEEREKTNDVLLALLGSDLVGGGLDLVLVLVAQAALDDNLGRPVLRAHGGVALHGDAVGLGRGRRGPVARVVPRPLDRIGQRDSRGHGDEVPVGVSIAAGLGLHQVEVPGAGGGGGGC